MLSPCSSLTMCFHHHVCCSTCGGKVWFFRCDSQRLGLQKDPPSSHRIYPVNSIPVRIWTFSVTSHLLFQTRLGLKGSKVKKSWKASDWVIFLTNSSTWLGSKIPAGYLKKQKRRTPSTSGFPVSQTHWSIALCPPVPHAASMLLSSEGNDHNTLATLASEPHAVEWLVSSTKSPSFWFHPRKKLRTSLALTLQPWKIKSWAVFLASSQSIFGTPSFLHHLHVLFLLPSQPKGPKRIRGTRSFN